MNYFHEDLTPSEEDVDRLYCCLMDDPDKPQTIRELAEAENTVRFDSARFVTRAVLKLIGQGCVEVVKTDQIQLRLPTDEV